ncbi:MAG: lipid A phosphate methyltransferase [Pseudomonadota bacterium]|nr:lipid A phosphate methyltransferase [Pseudomonadota bacterium]
MLYRELEKTGQFLFRWRSFLPFLIIFVAIWFAVTQGLAREIREDLEHMWVAISMAVSCTGLLLRAFIVGCAPRNTSGRTTEQQKANSLNITGMYSMVRHPLYFANFIVFSGFVMLFQSIEFYVISALVYSAYYTRIMMAEERFLSGRFGQAYEDWASKTPAFWPDIRKWQKPARPFSWKKALRQEMPGILLASTVFFLFEFVEDVIVEHMTLTDWYRTDHFWLDQFLAVLAGYCIVKVLRKKTSLLSISG